MATDSCGVNAPSIAEDVAPLGEPFSGDARNHLVGDEGDVVIRPRLVLRRDLVRAQERGHDVHGVRVVEPLDDAQLTQLRIERQSVAALRFAGRRAVRGHLVEPRPRGGNQLVLRRRPGRGHGSQNAPSFGRDLRVGRAREPALQLLAPVAGEDEMRVGIDEAGNRRCSRAHRSVRRQARS